MAIKIKYKDPISSDFGPEDIIINIKKGTLFYKSEKSIFQLKGDNLNTTTDTISFGNSTISASKGFFATPGLHALKIKSPNQVSSIYTFKVGPQPTIEAGGHVIPSSSASPIYDLGSPTNPFRKLYISPSSIHFIKTRAGVGGSRIGSTFIVGSYRKETIPEEEENLTQENISDLKEGKSIVSQSLDIAETGEAEEVDGISNYIRPEVIFHPTDNESALIHKTEGRLHYRSAGGDPFEIYCDGGSNDYIRLGSTTTNNTKIKLHGTISASIDGGSF